MRSTAQRASHACNQIDLASEPLSTGSEHPSPAAEPTAPPPETGAVRPMTKAQEARQHIDHALERLSEDLNAGKSETLTAFLAMVGKFHRYSFGNVMLILSQRPDASRVAGYRTWQTLGRQVRKGEKGITIIAPMMLKREAEQQEDDPEKVLRFKATSVFDVSQTDGDELPQPAQMQGTPREHLQRLEQFITGLGIVLELRMDIGQAAGVSMGGHICIRPELSPAERFSVLVHELAHEMLHHGDGAQRGDKQMRELEAEAVAYVVSSGIGLEPGTACSDYIHTYGGDAEKLVSVLDRVQKTAARILDAVLIPSNESEEQPPAAANA